MPFAPGGRAASTGQNRQRANERKKKIKDMLNARNMPDELLSTDAVDREHAYDTSTPNNSRLSLIRHYLQSALEFLEELPVIKSMNPYREKLRGIIASQWFQSLIVVLIVLNSISMGVATFPFVTDSDYYSNLFEEIDLGFLIVFTIELCFQFFVHRLNLFADGWLFFDFLLIVFSWAFNGVTIIRSFRIFRALRLFARVGPLKKMVTALTMTIPHLSAILAVFTLVYSVFAIMLTQLYKDVYREDYVFRYGEETDYFGRLDYTLFTLFLVMTTDNWNDAVLFGDGTFQIMWYITICFMLISNLVLLNLVIAVLCSTLTHLRVSMSKDTNVTVVNPELAMWFSVHVLSLRKDLDDLISLNLSFAKSLRKGSPSVNFNVLDDSEIETKYIVLNKYPEGVLKHQQDTNEKQGSSKSLSLVSEVSSEDEIKYVNQLKSLRSNLRKMKSTLSVTGGNEITDFMEKRFAEGDEENEFDISSDSESNNSKTSDLDDNDDYLSFRQKTVLKFQSMKDSSNYRLQDLFFEMQAKVSLIVYSASFQNSIIALIFINSFMMALSTFDFIYDNEARSNTFEVIDLGFLITFTIELIMHFIVHGIRLFSDNWLAFDFLTISMSWGFSGVSIIRSFRIFRAFRLFGRVKAMKQVLTAILSTGSQLVVIASVLFILCYIFAVLFTQLFSEVEFVSDDDAYNVDYFGRLDYTFATLLMFLTFEGWSTVTLAVMEVYTWAWLPLLFFLFVGAFMALNLVVAMICDSMTALEEEIDIENLSEEEYSIFVVEWLSNQLQLLNTVMLSLFQVQLEVTTQVIPNPLSLLPKFEDSYHTLREADGLRIRFREDLAYMHEKGFLSVSSIDEESDDYNSSVCEERINPTEEPIPEGWALIQQKSTDIVENNNFQLFIVFLIAVNSVFLGLGTFTFVEESETTSAVFEDIDFAFLVIFTVELSLQFLSKRFELFRDSWLTFDFLIVVFSWAFSGVTIIRSFRIFRAFRLFGRIGPLKRTIAAIAQTVGQVGAIAFLTFVITYIFDVMLTSLFQDLFDEGFYDETGINYFGRLDFTAFTLVTFLTLDDWSDVVRMTQEKYWWAWIPMVAYMILTAIIVLNMIIAVLCDSITSLRRDEEEGCREVYKTQWDEALKTEAQKQADQVGEFRNILTSMLVIQLALSKEFKVNGDGTDFSHVLSTVLGDLSPRPPEYDCDQFSSSSDLSLRDDPSHRRSFINSKMSSVDEIQDPIEDSSDLKGGKFEAFRLSLEEIVISDNFQKFMTSLIGINSIMLGLSTFKEIEDNKTANTFLEITDQILLLIFTIELAMNLIVFQKQFFEDSWLNFDLLIIVLSWAFSGVSIIRSFRIFRAFRLFGRIESLRLTTSAMMSTGPEMTAIGLVLMLLYYIFAVMMTQLFGDLYDDGYSEFNYFGRLDYTMFTCLMLTTLERVDPITRIVSSVYWWGWIPIFIFIVLISYVVLSLVIGAFCEAIFTIRALEREKQKNNAASNSRLNKFARRQATVKNDNVESYDFPALQKSIEEFEFAISTLKSFPRTLKTNKSLIKEMASRKHAEFDSVHESHQESNNIHEASDDIRLSQENCRFTLEHKSHVSLVEFDDISEDDTEPNDSPDFNVAEDSLGVEECLSPAKSDRIHIEGTIITTAMTLSPESVKVNDIPDEENIVEKNL